MGAGSGRETPRGRMSSKEREKNVGWRRKEEGRVTNMVVTSTGDSGPDYHDNFECKLSWINLG